MVGGAYGWFFQNPPYGGNASSAPPFTSVPFAQGFTNADSSNNLSTFATPHRHRTSSSAGECRAAHARGAIVDRAGYDEALADVAQALGFTLSASWSAVPIGIDYEAARAQPQYVLRHEGQVAFDGTPRECSAFLIAWRDLRARLLSDLRVIDTQIMPEMSGRSMCPAHDATGRRCLSNTGHAGAHKAIVHSGLIAMMTPTWLSVVCQTSRVSGGGLYSVDARRRARVGRATILTWDDAERGHRGACVLQERPGSAPLGGSSEDLDRQCARVPRELRGAGVRSESGEAWLADELRQSARAARRTRSIGSA